ncbi:deaminase [Actinomadura flavalba]|uniref:deaminase n=1 Tax=Actinomadura flavalba TaxID=1120938 RepID=UPI0003754509|nr:deaminase [Actinomadura flavalba]
MADGPPPGPAGDPYWLGLACDLAALCPPSETAFSVGAVIVAADGTELARGYSRESGPRDHAEEAALAKLGPSPALRDATIYSSLEPCGRRASRPSPCADLILAAGLPRVVQAWSEPDLFVAATGAVRLLAAGVELRELPELADRARRPNRHLLD